MTSSGATARGPAVLSLGAAVVVSVVVLGPALARGFVLSYDMVFVPDQPLVGRSVGLGAQLPRAVPVDAVVAVLSAVTGGEILQKLALLGSLTAAGTGAGLLAARCATVTGYGRLAAVVGACLAVWNPWVAQRLVMGHWSLLVGYAVLPWIVLVASRDPVRGRTAATVVLMAVGAITPTGGVMAAVTAVAVTVRRRSLAAVVAAAVVVNAPWWVPALLHPARGTSDPAGVSAFALRAETRAGALVSALGTGGIWNGEVVSAGRASGVAQAASLLLLVAAGWGIPALRRGLGARLASACLALAFIGFLLATASIVPGVGEASMRWLAEHVPGGGLLRDAHKWLALCMPAWTCAAALGFARLAGRLVDREPSRGRRIVAAGACGTLALSLTVLSVPDLAWGAGGRLRPVDYPQDWYAVSDILDERPADEVVVVLPFQPFRAFEWNGGRTVLDPAPRWYRQEVVVEDRLPVGDVLVSGESAWADTVRAALDADDVEDALAQAGVGWVLVERQTPGALPAGWHGGTRAVHSGDALELHRIEPPVRAAPEGDRPAAVPVVAANVAALALLALSAVRLLVRPRRPPGPSRSSVPEMID